MNIHIFNYKVERLLNDIKRNCPYINSDDVYDAYDEIRDKIKSSIELTQSDRDKLNLLDMVM